MNVEQDKLMALAQLYGGEWLYNPEADTPHRFWVGRHMNVSHSDMFSTWDGKNELPIADDFCSWSDYGDRGILTTIINEKINTAELQDVLIANLTAKCKRGLASDMKLVLATEDELADAILKTLRLWKREYDTETDS